MIFLDSLDDPRLAVYRNLKERELARQGGQFIAESGHVVRRLLASDYPVESVLVSQRRAEEMSQIVPASVPLYVVPNEWMHQIIGYKFHSGIIACGRRKPPAPLEQLLPPLAQNATVVICPELANHENLGSLIRISNAFGVDAMILGEHCCDPFYRLSIRVSMGTIFSLPMVQSDDLHRDMRRLKQEFGFQLAATVLGEDAESLDQVRRDSRLGILFGNEAQGLTPAEIAACDRRITIPMRRGTDSLNVSVAAGIFLYHFTRA